MAQASGNSSAFGLVLLRLTLGLNLFVHHGIEKLTHFHQMGAHFPDPIHIGSHASLIFATLSDGICSLLVTLGFGTRIAALIIAINVGVAFWLVHHHSFASGHTELVLIYFGGFLALVFTGGGAFSLDMKLWGRS